MDFVNTELAGYKLLFSLLLPESFYIYKLRFYPLATLRIFFLSLTKKKRKKYQLHRLCTELDTFTNLSCTLSPQTDVTLEHFCILILKVCSKVFHHTLLPAQTSCKLHVSA